MSYPRIEKKRAQVPGPNMLDYEATRAAFSWQQAERALSGLPGGRGLNIAFEAVDRHSTGKRKDQTDLRWLGKDGQRRDISFAELSRLTNRFASALESLGVRKGDRVFTLLGRVPDLYVAALGALKHRAV